MKTPRGSRRVATTLYPRNFTVFRNLSFRVTDVSTTQLAFADQMVMVPRIVERIQARSANNPLWREFGGVTVNNIELGVPSRVAAAVEPLSWWCSNCNKFYSGAANRLGIRNGICPSCERRSILQMASEFMCPRCHKIEPVRVPTCDECGDSDSVVLRGMGGRRGGYKWECTKHPGFSLQLVSYCANNHARERTVLKSTGGHLYRPESIKEVVYSPIEGSEPKTEGALTFTRARATIVEAVVGRTPIADTRNFYRNREFSPVEPFYNQTTGRYLALVSQLTTEAVIIDAADRLLSTEVVIHSLEHVLLNAAPAVTGLTQDEFGGYLDRDNARLVIYDGVPGGTGGCRILVERRLRRWLAIASELAECHQVQCSDACRACLFLPSRVCGQNNEPLDRHELAHLL